MINVFLKEVCEPELRTIMGAEALGVGEKMKLFFKETSLGIDKRLSSFKTTAHTVDYRRVRDIIMDQDYFSQTNTPIPAPAFFDPNKITWEAYCKAIDRTPALVSYALTESSRFYDWLKEIARKGVVGKSFSYSIANTQSFIFEMENFVKTDLRDTKDSVARLNQFYSSFGQLFVAIDQYNATTKQLKSRDIELLAKQLDLVADIGNLICDKVAASAIVLKEADLAIIQTQFTEHVKLANMVGVMVGLLNEQNAVFTEQLKTLSE